MAGAPKPSSAAAVADKKNEKSQDPPPHITPNTNNGGNRLSTLNMFLFIVPLLLGIAIGGYLTAYLLESEYQIIVAQLRSDHLAAIDKAQSNHIKCQSNLSDEKKSYMGEIAKCRMYANQSELAFQKRVEEYLKETNMAYKYANEGLEKAKQRVNMEIDKRAPLLSDLSQSEKRLQAIRNTLTESTNTLERVKIEHNQTAQELEQVQSELDAAEDELDRRDLERVECDEHHRNLRECRKYIDANIPENQKKVAEMNERLIQKVNTLEEKIRGKNEQCVTSESPKVKEIVQEKEFWERKASLIMDKVAFRSRKDVLDRFGPGPHFVKFTLSIDGYSKNESFLLELAPLDIMPHTILMFLDMAEKKVLNQGTMILARDHILVGGPVDAHDITNNQELENRMVETGYFPHGALLFSEYSPDYPHTQWTFGFNHLGGPIFYFNLHDNTELHGPNYTDDDGYKEGDPCFAKLVEGVDVITRILDMTKLEDDSFETKIYIVDSEVVQVKEA